jgi:hypothetical protein
MSDNVDGGRPTRKRKQVQSMNAQLSSETTSEWFNQFKATLADSKAGDGKQATQVELFFTDPVGLIKTSQVGVSGTNGHAEMNALDAIFKLHGYDQGKCATILDSGITVKCEAKPCCVRCSVVLGGIGAGAETDNTKKINKTMGQTQWVVSQKLAEILATYLGVSEWEIKNIHNLAGRDITVKKPK